MKTIKFEMTTSNDGKNYYTHEMLVGFENNVTDNEIEEKLDAWVAQITQVSWEEV